MSKAFELARALEKLHINNMYKQDFYWTWGFRSADALRQCGATQIAATAEDILTF